MSSYLGFPPTDAENAVFISYNTEDSNRIQPIVCKLHEFGVPLWYDYGLEYGESWSTQIAAHIDACRSVILFFSRNILKKENSFVRKEYKMAKEFYNKKVIVVLLDLVSKRDVPYHMVDWWIDISSDQNIVAYNIPHDEIFCRKLAHAAGFACTEAAQPVKPEEAAPPQLKPQSQPTPKSSIENWKEVQQRQLTKTPQTKQLTSTPQPSKKPAVENWKEVQRRLLEESMQKSQQPTQPEPEPEQNTPDSTQRIALALKNAMDLVKYEILEFPREPLPTEPEPFRENWKEVQKRQREKDKK